MDSAQAPRGTGPVPGMEQSPLRSRCAGLRVRLRDGRHRITGAMGSPIRRFRQCRAGDHRSIHRRRALEVGPGVQARASATARVRRAGARALERASGAIHGPRCSRQHSRSELHDSGSVFPFAAAPGVASRKAAARRDDAQELAATSEGPLRDRGPCGGIRACVAGLRRGPRSGRRAPPPPVFGQGLLRSDRLGSLGKRVGRGSRPCRASVSVSAG